MRLLDRVLTEEREPASSAQVQAAWHQEIADRLQALERGEAELVDASEVFARIRTKLTR